MSEQAADTITRITRERDAALARAEASSTAGEKAACDSLGLCTHYKECGRKGQCAAEASIAASYPPPTPVAESRVAIPTTTNEVAWAEKCMAFAQALCQHNEALRSAHEVCKRSGKETNWDAFTRTVHKTLCDGHAASNEAREMVRATESPTPVAESKPAPEGTGEGIEPWVQVQLDRLLPMVRQGRDAPGQIEAWEAVCAVVHEVDNALPEGAPAIDAVPAYIRRLQADSAALTAMRDRAEKADGCRFEVHITGALVNPIARFMYHDQAMSWAMDNYAGKYEIVQVRK